MERKKRRKARGEYQQRRTRLSVHEIKGAPYYTHSDIGNDIDTGGKTRGARAP
jgi:hypothetical protein